MDNKLQKIHDELVEKANELVEKANELLKKIKEGNKVFGRQRVEDKVNYFYLCDSGVSHTFECHYEGDKENFEQGNYYLTKEEAEKALARQKAIVKVNDAIDELNKGWIVNWSSEDKKYNIYYNFNTKEYQVSWQVDFTMDAMVLNFMKSQEIAEKIIKDYKKELNLIFNI